jgi:hypothetical protein
LLVPYHLDAVDASRDWRPFLAVAGFVGAECLYQVAETVGVANDLRLPEVVFGKKRCDLLDPLIVSYMALMMASGVATSSGLGLASLLDGLNSLIC